MRALTVQQPWAWSVIYAGKLIENRTTPWAYRGPLAIHAGQRWSHRGAAHPEHLNAWLRQPLAVQDLVDTTGAILGVVEMVGAHVAEDGCCDSPWAEREYEQAGGKLRRDVAHLVVENPRPLLEPIPAKGALGLWRVPADLQLAIHEGLA